MRLALALCAAVFVLAGCAGSTHYLDTNAAVDANPMCVSRPDRPGEPVSRDCERKSEGSISSERASQPIDFRKRSDD